MTILGDIPALAAMSLAMLWIIARSSPPSPVVLFPPDGELQARIIVSHAFLSGLSLELEIAVVP